jgi:lipopolysaccharide assembly outer membrane protein LptD (OstA)
MKWELRVRKRYILTVLSVVVCCCAGVYGAARSDSPDAFASLDNQKEYNAPIEADADQLDYDKVKGRITASGHVVITYGCDELRADRVLVNVNSGDAYALGNVVIKRGGQADIKGTKIRYNFRTRVSSIDDPEVSVLPFHVVADKVTQSGRNEYVLHNAKVTTCKYKHPHSHYHFKAKRVTVVPGEYIRTKGAVLSLGRVPVMYLPYWRHNLAEDSGFRFLPGYRSRMGGYLLSSYYHRINSSLKAEHHIDYRSERGFALGEDLDWHTGAGIGNLRLYYLNDDDPMDAADIADGLDIDSRRYRIHLEHNQTFNERTQLLLQANYLSDPKVIEDFFNREYRHARQPETYASLSYRRDLYTVTALANVRLNDFYSNVNRLPELSLNFTRRQLGNSSFYYESHTSGAQLEKVWETGSINDDYSAVRFDTRHMIYQPRRYMGWLNFVPRAGYRGTYYSDTLTSITSNSVVTATGTNSMETTTNSVTEITNAAGQLRNMFEIGAEISFKAFKTMNGGAMRHIVEPYANYTFRMEPDVVPDELYQFDSIDGLDEVHQTLLGVRNKIQSKRNGRPHDLADINTFTTLNFNSDEDEDMFDKLYLDSDFYPADWLYINLYGIYGVSESELEEFNTRFNLVRDNIWKVRAEHRYRLDDSNLLTGTITVYPNIKWAFNVFGRYEFEDSRVQEQGGYIERKLDCIGMRLGGSVLPGFTRTDGTEKEDEYRIMLSFWLTAFPQLGLHTNM